jgi:uncharacterized protein (TIGR02246 family)
MHEKSEFRNQPANCDAVKASRHRSVVRPGGMSRFGLAILVLAASLCGTGLAYGQKQNKKNKKDAAADANVSTASLMPDNQAVDLLVSQMLGAWQAGDADGMHKFYADDVMVISGAFEPPLIGWANYARAYQAQFARTSGCRLERINSYTKVTGDTAVVTYQWQFLGNVDGRNTQAFGHTTLLLEKRLGNWLITLNHTSAIPTDDPSTSTPVPAAGGHPTSSLAPAAK